MRTSKPGDVSKPWQVDFDNNGKHFDNTSSNIISINDDKLKLKLTENFDHLKNNRIWFHYFSVAIALFIPILTTEKFKSILGFSGDIIAGILIATCIIFLFIAVINFFKYRKKITIGSIVEDIKTNQ